MGREQGSPGGVKEILSKTDNGLTHEVVGTNQENWNGCRNFYHRNNLMGLLTR